MGAASKQGSFNECYRQCDQSLEKGRMGRSRNDVAGGIVWRSQLRQTNPPAIRDLTEHGSKLAVRQRCLLITLNAS